MMEYLEGEEPSVEALKAALRKATCECAAIPVCCGTAYRNKGVQKLLDAILEYMPAPTDIPAIKGHDMEGNEVEKHSSDDEPFAALAFKIMTDPFVGKLAFFQSLLRYDELRFLCAECNKRKKRACWTYPADAC